VGHRDGLDAVVERKIPSPYRDSNPVGAGIFFSKISNFIELRF